MQLHIPQLLTPYHMLAPAADAAGRSSTYLSLKNAVKAWAVFYIEQGNAATIALSIQQATNVAGAGSKAINAARIWTKLDEATADFAQQAEAASFTTDAALKKKIVIFELDLVKVFDVAGDFDCLRLTTGASNVANITSGLLFIQPKDGGATIPSPLTD
jgi:hypothetical protein